MPVLCAVVRGGRLFAGFGSVFPRPCWASGAQGHLPPAPRGRAMGRSAPVAVAASDGQRGRVVAKGGGFPLERMRFVTLASPVCGLR